MTNSAFPQDPALTAIAIAYRNPDVVLIADSVLPRSGVDSPRFEWTEYDDPYAAFTLPETRVGPRGRVNRVELGGQRKPGQTEDDAIEVPLSFFDVNATGQNVNARGRATEFATSIILLKREVRVANLAFDPGNYPLKETVAAGDGFDDPDSDPLALITEGLDAALMRPNRLVFGNKTWSDFRRHPKVVKAVQGNDGDSGLASRQAVAQLLEVQEVLVGSSILNIKKPGEAVELVRAWGNHLAAIFIDRTAGTVGGVTFGFTAEYGARVAGSRPDANLGLRGGELVKVGESTKELIVAPHAGYFWENATAA